MSPFEIITHYYILLHIAYYNYLNTMYLIFKPINIIFTHVFLLPQVVKAREGVVEEKKKEPYYKCKTKGILM